LLSGKLGLEADQFLLERLQKRAGTEEAMEGNPEHASCFMADLNAAVAQSRRRLSHGCSGGLRSAEVVGDGERFDDLMTVALGHCAEDDVIEMDIGTDG
jgi:hypothetical protein